MYIIWDPIYGGSFDREAKKLSISFPDKRVRYFKDPNSFAGNLWGRVLKLQNQREIAWDVYLLYGADAEWENEPPQPAFWMHQLRGVSQAPTLDVSTLTAKLKDMLKEIKTTSATEAVPTCGHFQLRTVCASESIASRKTMIGDS